MVRKKSLKKAGKRVEAGQKSKDRKKILKLVDEAKGGYLGPEEVDNAVSELRRNPQSASLLREIALGRGNSLARKIRAADILKDLGTPLDEELQASLKAAFNLTEESHGFLKDPDEKLFLTISAQVSQLSSHLQSAFVQQLMEEAGEKSLLLLTRIAGTSEVMDLIIAESLAGLPIQGAVDLLYKMSAQTDYKTVRKTVKRSLYRLKEKGAVIKDWRFEDSQVSVFRPPARVSEGYLSAIDNLGARLVLLAQPGTTRGLYLFEVLTDDTEGMTEFQNTEITRKAYKEYLTLFKEESPLPIVEADPSYCRFLMEEGYALAIRKGHSMPVFSEWKNKMGKPHNETQTPLIYSYVRDDLIRADEYLLRRCGTLFELPEFSNWTIESREIEKYVEMIRDANESKLILTPVQKEERIFQIYNDAVEELFNREKRFIYGRRLEEMAYVIHKLGREEDAGLCLAASLALKDTTMPSYHHPFLLVLMERSVSFALRQEEKKEREDLSLIVRP